MPYKRMINVSDINAWLYCARKLYLQRVKKLPTKPSKPMIMGKLKHNILENFSKNEEKFISAIDKDYDKLDLLFKYEDFLKKISERVFIENISMINAFAINKEEILKKVLADFSEDLKIRIKNLKEKMALGIFGDELWKSLDTIYISEMKLESEELGLKGRVDRVEILKKENKIIPYELKTREDRIFHSDELQVAAYALLLERYYKIPVPKGIVEVSGKKQELIITDEHKREIIEIVKQINNMLDGNLVPPMLSNFSKCRMCEFNEICADAA